MNRRGLMMIEMLVALALISAAALVIARMHTTMLKFVAEAPDRDRQVVSWESTLHRLRTDVWSARQVTGVSADALRLEMEQGEIVWQIAGEHLVRQGSLLEDLAEQRWPLPSGLSFRSAGGIVELHGEGGRVAIPLPHPPSLLATRGGTP